MKRWLGAVLLSVLGLLGVQSAAPTGPTPVALTYWADPSGQATLVQAEQATYRPVERNGALGFRPGAIWLRFRPDTALHQPVLVVPVGMLDHLDLHVPRPDGGWSVIPHGRLTPRDERPLPTRDGVFLIPADWDRTRSCYLRVRTISTLVVEARLWDRYTYLNHDRRVTFLLGLSSGMLLLIVAVHGLFGALARSRASLLYAGLVVLSGINLLTLRGAVTAFWFPAHPEVERSLFMLSACFLLGYGWTTLTTLAELRGTAPRLVKGFAWSSHLVGGAGMVFYLLGDYPLVAPLINAHYLVNGLVLLGIGLRAGWRGSRSARLFLVAFSPYLLALALRASRNLGVLPDGALADQGPDITLSLHLLLMNLPLIERYLRIRSERDEAVRRSLAEAGSRDAWLQEQVLARTLDLEREKSRTEQALAVVRQAMEDQRRFIQGLSHDLRTPLSIIDGNLQLIALERGDNALNTERLPRVQAQVRRLLGVLDEALDQDRLEQGGWTLDPRPTPPEQLLERLEARVAADPRRPAVRWMRGSLPSEVSMDLHMVDLAVGNLLENAIRYSPSGGAVTVAAHSTPDGGLAIAVTDQGPGIPEGEQERIFQRYYRTSPTPDLPGTGLGLYLSREIAHLHGGSLTVRSQAGHGATFTLELPGPA